MVSVNIGNELEKGFSQLCGNLGMSIGNGVHDMLGSAVGGEDTSITASGYDENGFTPEEAAELKRVYDEARAKKNYVEFDYRSI